METLPRFDRLTSNLHWLIAIMVLASLGSGFAASQTGSSAALVAHLSAGALAALLSLFRLIRWFRKDTRPAPLSHGSAALNRIAGITHAVLRVLPIMMAVSGIGMLILSGAPALIAAGLPLPEFAELPPRTPHGIGARLVIAAISLHLAGTLYHRLADGTDLLKRFHRPGAIKP